MATTAIVPAPRAEDLKQEAAPLLQQAASIVVIKDADEYQTALELVGTLRRAEKRVAEAFEPTRKSLDQAKKDLLRLRDSIIEPIERHRIGLGKRCEPWEAEQRRLAEEERRRKEEELRKQEEERKFHESILAEEAGDIERAAEIDAAPVVVPFVEPERALPKVAGVSQRESWKAEVTDFGALIRFVAEDVEHRRHLLLPNEIQLNGEARVYKGELAIPGVRPVCEVVRSVRGYAMRHRCDQCSRGNHLGCVNLTGQGGCYCQCRERDEDDR